MYFSLFFLSAKVLAPPQKKKHKKLQPLTHSIYLGRRKSKIPHKKNYAFPVLNLDAGVAGRRLGGGGGGDDGGKKQSGG